MRGNFCGDDRDALDLPARNFAGLRERGIFTGADSSAEARLFGPSESIAENFSTFALPPPIEPEISPDNTQGPRNPSFSEIDAGDGKSILNDPSARADFP